MAAFTMTRSDMLARLEERRHEYQSEHEAGILDGAEFISAIEFLDQLESDVNRLEGEPSASNLDEFTTQYVETALWSSTDDDGEPLDGVFGIDDIATETLRQMVEDCFHFQADHAHDIASDPSRAGHDFWLTRNRHGAGFWDGDWAPEVGKRLTESAHAWGSVDLYIGDDGRIYSN